MQYPFKMLIKNIPIKNRMNDLLCMFTDYKHCKICIIPQINVYLMVNTMKSITERYTKIQQYILMVIIERVE